MKCEHCNSEEGLIRKSKRFAELNGKVLCKSCEKKFRSRLYDKKHKDKIKTRKHKYYLKNKESILDRTSKYRKKNLDKARVWVSKHRNKDIESYRNYDKNRAARRRAQKKSAIPSWETDFDKFVIEEIYSMCSLISELTGIDHHVDHIIPLVSKIVCGLHTPNNLRIITAKENLSKGNTFIID